MADKQERPQPLDLGTAERLGTTLRAVAQGGVHEIQRKHETAKGQRESVPEDLVRSVVERWPSAQKNIADQMIAKYGFPNEATPTKLFWYDRPPWKRIELTSDVVVHNWPTIHSDFLTQVIDYRVPPDMFAPIAQFDGSILLDRTKGEVAARCDSESANVLGMNMVHEIVTGRRTVEEARKLATESTVAYNMGRPAPYAERLLFEIPNEHTEDLDHSMISGSIVRQAAAKISDAVSGSDGKAVT